jgi:hypothetical protein
MIMSNYIPQLVLFEGIQKKFFRHIKLEFLSEGRFLIHTEQYSDKKMLEFFYIICENSNGAITKDPITFKAILESNTRRYIYDQNMTDENNISNYIFFLCIPFKIKLEDCKYFDKLN